MLKNILIVSFIIIVAGLIFYFMLSKKPSDQEIDPNRDLLGGLGVDVEILKEGEGDVAKPGDMVTVHYVGTLESGEKFDSSVDRETPFSFQLGAGRVIRGWDQGVAGMKIGEKRRLTISPELGYGESGVPGVIPPNAVLIFEVELLGIN